MKRKIIKSVVFILFLLAVPSFIAFYGNKVETNAAATESSVTNAYGYKLTIVRYTGVGEPERVGKPILIYHPDMMGEPTFVREDPAGLPNSHDDIMNSGSNYNLTQVWNDNDWGAMDAVISPEQYDNDYGWSYGGEGEPYSDRLGLYPKGAVDNPYLDHSGAKDPNDKVVRYTADPTRKAPPYSSPACNGPYAAKPFDCYNEMQIFDFSYMSQTRKVTFKKDMIRYDEDYFQTIEDPDLTQNNIDNNDYLSTLISRYAGSKSSIESNFGVTLNELDMRFYYVQAEVVQRILLYEYEDVGSYPVKTIKQDPPNKIGFIAAGEWHEDWLYGWCSEIESLGAADVYTLTLKEKQCYKEEDETYTTYYTRKKNQSCASGDYVSSVDSDGTKHCYGSRTRKVCAQWEDYCEYEGYYLPESLGCEYNGEVIYHHINGHISNGWSSIVTSRSNGSDSTFLSRAVNKCGSVYGEHCVLEEDGITCTNENEYYIGPNKENALVGPGSSYKYQLIGSCNPNASFEGIQHFYAPQIIELLCPDHKCCKEDVCAETLNAYGVRSDEYLKCAESYCEALVDYDTKGNARKRKLSCLLNKCSYSYGADPVTGDKNSSKRESANSCNNSEIVKEYKRKENLLKLNSTCNKTSDGRYVPDQKGVYVEACNGDQVTDFDDDEKNDTIFDQRTYVNKICMETASFDFVDTSILNLTKGSGFTYPVQQEGDKTCIYFINLEQWKVDYASAPARDPELRSRMQYILDSFNSQVETTTSLRGSNYRDSFDGEGYGSTNFEHEGYDFGKTTIGSKETETLVTGDKVVTQNGMVVAKKSAMTNLVQSNSMDVSYTRGTSTNNMTDGKLSTVANDSVTIIENGTIGSRPVNRYMSNASGELTYTLEKVCISTDGLATVTKAPANEICFTTKDGNTDKNVYAEDKYYTSFKMDTNMDHPISAQVSVGKSSSSDAAKYYEDNEACTYRVSSGQGCQLKVETLDDGKKLGNKQYESARIKVNIFYDLDQSDIQKVSIFDNDHETNAEEITVTNRNNRSMEVHKIVGKITLKSGKVLTCEDTIDLYSGGCGNKCSVNKLGETIYEIVADGATNYYTYTSSHMTPSLSVLSQENSKPYEFMEVVYKSVTDGRHYIRLSEALQKDEILFGYVTTGSNSCNNYCYTNATNSNNDCYRLYKPIETGDIHDYCYANWKNDANGFIDDDDCYKKCTLVCPNNRNNLTVVENYCASYSLYGFPDYEHCMNKCYKEDNDDGKGDYLFRSVNVLDPFPNSQESEGIFEKGDRIVGKNWKFLSGYITDDSEDKTSVTGAFANTKVEYVIDLSPKDIRELRRDTEGSDLNTSKNKRGVYAKLDRVTGNGKTVEEYRSQFLHNSDFTSLFQTGHGSIQASFKPGTN